MSPSCRDVTREVARIERVSDMLCTGHAHLRDTYYRRALFLELVILGASTWLLALTFVEPRINARLTPFNLDPQMWTGIIGITVFFLTLIQIKNDWKGRSDAHRRTADLYAEVKREARCQLSLGLTDEAFRKIVARYDLANATGIPMPESQFLRQKRRHKIKVALSQYLDQHPGAWLPAVYLRMWIRDNFCSWS